MKQAIIQFLIQLGLYDSIMITLAYIAHNAHYGITVLIGLSAFIFNIIKIRNLYLQNQKLKKEINEKTNFTDSHKL